ncbi:hypothetical protein D3C81_2120490 [compost metagenome]
MDSFALFSAAFCAANTLPSKEMDLISQCSQRLSSIETQATPAARASSDGKVSGLPMMNTVGVISVFGKACERRATPRVTCI